MWKMLLKIRDKYGTTIFLTTHYLEEADHLSDTICIMKAGKELAQGTPDDLRRYTRQNILRIKFSDIPGAKKCKDALDNTSLTKFINIRENSVFAGVDNLKSGFTAINKWLLDHHVEFMAIEIAEPSLEDVFLALTGSRNNRWEELMC